MEYSRALTMKRKMNEMWKCKNCGHLEKVETSITAACDGCKESGFAFLVVEGSERICENCFHCPHCEETGFIITGAATIRIIFDGREVLMNIAGVNTKDCPILDHDELMLVKRIAQDLRAFLDSKAKKKA